MDKTSLGNRMKEYENCFNIKMPRKLPVIIRIDGKSFHSMVKKWNCHKPFDESFKEAMRFTAFNLAEEISGTIFVYTQSDEISLIIKNDQTLETQPWFDNKMQKIVSIAASKASSLFNYYLFKLENNINNINELANFDARCFIVPNDHEIINYLIWRQQDCIKNSVSMLANSYFSSKQLHGKNVEDRRNMLKEVGIDWKKIDYCYKHGSMVSRKPKFFINHKSGEKNERNKWELEEVDFLFHNDKEKLSDLIEKNDF